MSIPLRTSSPAPPLSVLAPLALMTSLPAPPPIQPFPVSLRGDQTNPATSQNSGTVPRSSPHRFTEKQGQYLAFIYVYAHMFRQAPAKADMQRHFRVTPPTVHQMVLGLERDGLISRQPGVARSISLHVPPQDLPILQWLRINSSKSL